MMIPSREARRLWQASGAERWSLTAAEFEAALERSAAHWFRDAPAPDASAIAGYLAGVHLEDLALACACARGHDAAWEHFVREYRPILLRIAGRGQRADRARDVADSLYADLFGLDDRAGARRSLFDYYHGRSTLAGWLKAVVAQRLVDKARAERRTEPMPDGDAEIAVPGAAEPPDLDRRRQLAAIRVALRQALAGLDAKDRLRLSLYYGQALTLARIGRALGESEATASRKLDRARRAVRSEVERRLREDHGMTAAEIDESFGLARTDPAFDLARALPPDQVL
jgi:RNA polymerase sigma-70 factor, ECF subfamily